VNACENESAKDLKLLEELDATRLRLLEMKAELATRREEIHRFLLKTHPMHAYMKAKAELLELTSKDQHVQADLSRLKTRRSAVNKKLNDSDAGARPSNSKSEMTKELTATLYDVAVASFDYLYNDDEDKDDATGDALEEALRELDRLRPGWRDNAKPKSKKRS
jgi:hypothetical protein